MHPKFI
jgi:aryl-alcohol dehydrogenase-like predicted oxidoreductase